MGRGQREVNRLHPRRMDGAEVERVEVRRQKIENTVKFNNTRLLWLHQAAFFRGYKVRPGY